MKSKILAKNRQKLAQKVTVLSAEILISLEACRNICKKNISLLILYTETLGFKVGLVEIYQ